MGLVEKILHNKIKEFLPTLMVDQIFTRDWNINIFV